MMFGSLPSQCLQLRPSNRKAFIAAACTIPADCVFAVSLYLVYPDSLLPAALFIVNFSLILLAMLGINARISSMILPAVIWKCILLLFLLFVGCISIDAFQSANLPPPNPEFPAELSTSSEQDLTDSVQVSRSVAVWRQLSARYPLLPFFAVACTVILAIEARVFFSAWQKICCPIYTQDDQDLEKNPPAYHHCVQADKDNHLPSYEDALRAAQSSTQANRHVTYVTSKIFTV
ncbi:unnamed protein product [Caenorhabditis angaria]|uniref:Uncharacterized protein n=1 Tax=Caenorhabditis angaria TaxID=860376 RepID=A0A9P1IDF8_9PELO|nr:unnamed protein product [Caenorhabditis angaria]